MPLSSNSIFHYTRSFETLASIIEKKFTVSYCRETYLLDDNEYRLAIPMVSFCDIPLSQVYEHVDKYGGYGIGLSKKWAFDNYLNPVLYVSNKSIYAHLVEPLLSKVLENDEFGSIRVRFQMKKDGEKVILQDVFTGDRRIEIEALVGQLSFIKNYSGKLFRNDGELVDESYKFYDEREWRYVPVDGPQHFHHILTEDEYTQWRGEEKQKPTIKGLSLDFMSKDTDYIIVEKESEISPMINKLKGFQNFYTNDEDYNLLISRLISMEKIREDF